MNTKRKKKCKYYDKWTWVEPPLEEGDNGTPYTEYDCKNAKGYFVASCCGKKENCMLPLIHMKKKINWSNYKNHLYIEHSR